jgi:hypothetical protein
MSSLGLTRASPPRRLIRRTVHPLTDHVELCLPGLAYDPPPALDQADHNNTTASPALGTHRCGWCGLFALPEADRWWRACDCAACASVCCGMSIGELFGTRQGFPLRDDPEIERVMIRCPITSRSIETGLRAHPKTWQSRPIGLNRVSCPACKQSHAWSKNDAFLEGSSGPS